MNKEQSWRILSFVMCQVGEESFNEIKIKKNKQLYQHWTGLDMAN